MPNRQTAANQGAVGGLPSNYDVVNEAFGPRFPRYDLIPNHEKRVGFTGSAQWQPDNDTLFTLDVLASDFAVQRQEEYLEANSLSLNGAGSNLAVTGTPALLANTLARGNVNILSYILNETTNNLNAFTATNVGLRTEHRLDHLDTRFGQATLDVTHDFGNDFKVHGLMGWSESHHNNPIQTTLTLDYDCTAATAGGSTANCAGGWAGGAGSVARSAQPTTSPRATRRRCSISAMSIRPRPPAGSCRRSANAPRPSTTASAPRPATRNTIPMAG